jgi:hypothetical protein
LTPTPTETPTPPPLPPFEPLSACWVRDWNQAQTEWHIDNPNPVPLSTNPEVKVRYNWTVYDAFNAQGSVVQSATGWDNANPNPLNTPWEVNNGRKAAKGSDDGNNKDGNHDFENRTNDFMPDFLGSVLNS